MGIAKKLLLGWRPVKEPVAGPKDGFAIFREVFHGTKRLQWK